MGRRALAAAADRRQPQKQQHKKKKAAGSCCGGGFAPLAAGHAGEESRRRPNSRTARTAAAASVRFPVPRPLPRLKLLIITANYLPGSSPFFFAAAGLSGFGLSGFRASRLLLPPRWILPPLQLNACGNGGFCRRRWILPSAVDFLPSAVDFAAGGCCPNS